MPSDAAPVLSVITVSWNTRELLLRCLRGVAREAAELPHEIVVVDNASADGSADAVAREHPEVSLIRNPDNRGFGSACNQGIERSSGRFVLLLNPDAEPRPGALAALVAFLESNPDVGAMGPLLVDAGGAPTISYGHFPSLRTALLPLFRPVASLLPGRAHLHGLGVVPPPTSAASRPRDVDYVSGAALTLRREALHRVGTFDEQFFLYFEETDLCRRLHGGGHRVVFDPRVAVTHHGGASRERRSEAALADYHASLDIYLRKHHRPAYVTLVRGAMIFAYGVRYMAARAAARTKLAEHYRASVRAMRATAHA